MPHKLSIGIIQRDLQEMTVAVRIDRNNEEDENSAMELYSRKETYTDKQELVRDS